MDNKHKNFLTYINKPISREATLILYDANNIKYEKCELYSDFTQSLLRLIFNTYLGDDVTNLEQQNKHFKWCWDKNIDNFKKEGIDFESLKLYNYFLEFTLVVFYSVIDKKNQDYTDKQLLRIWYNIFDYNKVKTSSDIDTLVEIYLLFEHTLHPINK